MASLALERPPYMWQSEETARKRKTGKTPRPAPAAGTESKLPRQPARPTAAVCRRRYSKIRRRNGTADVRPRESGRKRRPSRAKNRIPAPFDIKTKDRILTKRAEPISESDPNHFPVSAIPEGDRSELRESAQMLNFSRGARPTRHRCSALPLCPPRLRQQPLFHRSCNHHPQNTFARRCDDCR